MRRRLALPVFCLALLLLSIAAASASAAKGGTPVKCAQTEKTTIAPSGSPAPPANPPSELPCWGEIQPYPFGADGEAVGQGDPEPGSECAPGSSEPEQCYLTVTSMAFRAWNRGLAATTSKKEPEHSNPFGVWVFDGTSWSPSPGFLGSKVCPGNTVAWAGKLDYWLVGPGPPQSGQPWSRICRFDGVEKQWEPLELPQATQARAAGRIGGITSAACFAWNNCWFFGTYGVVVHWNGEILEDASPPLSERRLHGEYMQAIARENLSGEPFGVAVGADEEHRGGESTEKLPPETEKGRATAPQIYGSRGGAFLPLTFAPPANEPLGTDLVAADFDAAEQGWVLGNPGGLWLGDGSEPQPEPRRELHLHVTTALAPLEPLSASGSSTGCTPAPNFEYQIPGAPDPAGSFLWSSISVVPSSGEALAGGSMRQQDPKFGEPVIAQVGCDGTATLTRFRVPQPKSSSQPAPLVPADYLGTVTAIAANATNDAWAATSDGILGYGQSPEPQPPHLYRLSDEQPPAAPEGNDVEPRPLKLTEELLPPPQKPPPPEEPAPTPAPEAPPSVSQLPSITLPPAIYDVKVKLHKVKRHRRTYLSLYLTFKVLRPVTIGAQALRNGRVVSHARARLFAGTTGTLILSVERKRWPNAVRFTS